MIPIPCTYCGVQHALGHQSFALWTLLLDIPGHPVGSTVSEATMHDLGYEPRSVTPRQGIDQAV